MRILVDGDACPVKEEIISIAKIFNISVHIYIDINHILESDYAEVIYCDQGSDSVDLVLINRSQPGDIIITQDYGLASLSIAKELYVFDFYGKQYDKSNIDFWLYSRYVSAKQRKQGKRTGGPKPRTSEDNERFYKALYGFLKEGLDE